MVNTQVCYTLLNKIERLPSSNRSIYFFSHSYYERAMSISICAVNIRKNIVSGYTVA